MIPKIIHYCWFGNNPLPESAKNYIASWKKYFPDYEIKEWNESNFDLDCCDYVKEAYQAKKWAFVSDYARFWILYHEGGLYFDTDVEVVRSFDTIVQQGAFMGCEPFDKPGMSVGINPGLGFGAPAGHSIMKEMLDFYQNRHFIKENGEWDTTTVVEYTTDIMQRHGWRSVDRIQNIEGIVVYPTEYFCPMDYETGRITISSDTCSIHHYLASWYGKNEERIRAISRFCIGHFGTKYGEMLAGVLTLPYRVKKKVERIGLKETLKYALRRK